MFITTDTVKAAPGEERWLEVLGTLADSGRSLILALLQEIGFIPGVCEAATGLILEVGGRRPLPVWLNPACAAAGIFLKSCVVNFYCFFHTGTRRSAR